MNAQIEINETSYKNYLKSLKPDELICEIVGQLNKLNGRMDNFESYYEFNPSEDNCYNRFKENMKKYKKENEDEIIHKKNFYSAIVQAAQWIVLSIIGIYLYFKK